MNLRDVLNKIRWDSREQVRFYEVTYLHRGALENRRTIQFFAIKNIHSSWFTYDDPEYGEVTIPFHRILEIREAKSGRTIWKKRRQL